MRDCPAVYSFLLGSGHVMLIDDVEAVSLAHGFTDDKVVAHPYFGSQQVRADLAQMRGYSQGRVRLDVATATRRDSTTGLVCRLVQAAESS